MSSQKNMLDAKKIGERLASIRKKRKYTQVNIAMKLEIDNSRLSRIETGDIDLTAIELAKLSQVYCVSIYWILYGEEEISVQDGIYKAEITDKLQSVEREISELLRFAKSAR